VGDDVGPDQVVGANQAEQLGQIVGFHIALVVQIAAEGAQVVFVHEDGPVAQLTEIKQGGDQGGGGDPVPFARRRQIGERQGREGAAQAVGDEVRLALAGGLLDRVQGRHGAVLHVIRQGSYGGERHRG
jgi:hypothetical protein